MTGQTFKAIRNLLGFTQENAAKELGVSQRLISEIEKSHELSAENVERYEKIEKLARISRPLEIDRLLEDQFAIDSLRFSYRQPAFELLRKEVPHRARRVEVEAIISRSPDHKDFADAVMNIRFVELFTLDSADKLTIDCVGNPDGPGGKEAPVEVKLLDKEKLPQVLLEEDESVKTVRGIGKHAVSYQISGADPAMVSEFTVQIKSNCSFRMNKQDAIGFPLYPDLLVDSVRVQATFQKIRPVPSPPTVRPLLIRRHFRDAIPIFLTDPDLGVARPKPGDPSTFIFGPLLRPKAGYGYILSWNKLIAE